MRSIHGFKEMSNNGNPQNKQRCGKIKFGFYDDSAPDCIFCTVFEKLSWGTPAELPCCLKTENPGKCKWQIPDRKTQGILLGGYVLGIFLQFPKFVI